VLVRTLLPVPAPPLGNGDADIEHRSYFRLREKALTVFLAVTLGQMVVAAMSATMFLALREIWPPVWAALGVSITGGLGLAIVCRSKK
jgi:hypothetical protein